MKFGGPLPWTKVLVMLSKKKMQYCEILKAGGATLTPLKLPFKGKGVSEKEHYV